MSFLERLQALKATAADNSGNMVVHAIDYSANQQMFRMGICGQEIRPPETGSAGEQWMSYKRDPKMRPCPQCLKLWEALTSDERKILNLGY